MTDKLTTTLGSPLPKGMKSLSLVIGLIITSSGIYQFLHGSNGAFTYIVVGFICIACCSYNKIFSVSSEGVIREQRILGRAYREVLPWREVKSVSFAFRGNKLMALFEKGLKGWRVLFSRDAENHLRNIIFENRPDIQVEVLQK